MKKWKIWLPIGSLFALALVCWFLWSRTDLAEYSGKLEVILAKARKDGLPVTPNELRDRIAVPDSQNAAPIYKSALGMFKGMHPEESKELSILTQDVRYDSDKATWDRTAKLLTFADRELQRMKEGALLSGCDYHRSWELGPSVLFPEFASLKGNAKLLGLRALLRSRQGKPSEALDDLETARGMAIHCGQDPSLIGPLVQLALYSILADRLQLVVNHHPDPATLAKAKKLIESLKEPDFRVSAAGEVVMDRICFDMIARDPRMTDTLSALTEGSDSRSLALARFSSIRRGYEAKTVELMTDLYNSLPKDPSNYKAADEALKKMDVIIASDQSMAMGGARAIMPVYGAAGDALVNLVALKNSHLAAIRLLAEHKAGTPFPDKLPFKTLDPFTDKPLIYTRTKTGFLVYSVGRDRKDDKGVLSGEQDSSNGFDVGWRYPEGRQPKVQPRPSGSAGPPGAPAGFRP